MADGKLQAPMADGKLVEVKPDGKLVVKPDGMVEVKPDAGGVYRLPSDGKLQAPRASIDGKRPVDRLCMRARRLEVISDGTLAGTVLLVDGVPISGVVRFELVTQSGYPRVTALVDTHYDHAAEPGEEEARPALLASGRPAVVTIEIFKRA